MLSWVPLFHVGSPTGVRRHRPLVLVAWSRCSTCISLAACMPPHAGWWALKSPSRMTSPTASPKAVSSAVHALILGLLPLGLYMLIIDTVISHSKSWSTATYGPCCLWDQ